ncbi:MAG: DUF1573 domain-containing protein [Bacteriovoracaceae bacterium]
MWIFLIIHSLISLSFAQTKEPFILGKRNHQVQIKSGTAAETNFVIYNHQKTPLVIVSAKTSDEKCHVDFPKQPILTRQYSSLKVVCRFKKEVYFNRDVNVVTNFGVEKISVDGSVKPANAKLITPKKVAFFLEKELAPLMDLPCYKQWKAQLAVEGYKISEILSAKDMNTDDYRKQMLSVGDPLVGSMMVGNLKLPEKNLDVLEYYDADDGKTIMERDSKEVVQTTLPLMNPMKEINETGTDTKYFSKMKLWNGLISDGNHASPAKQRIDNFCHYFSRNQAYRTCAHTNELKVVGFIDKDWENDSNISDLRCLSTGCTMLKNLDGLKNINEKKVGTMDFCGLAVHSDPTFHYATTGLVTTSDINAWQPSIKFYNLFSCSAGHCLGLPNLAQTYLFSKTTLGVYASTKTGSVENPNLLYKYLKNNKTFGEALVDYQKDYLGNGNAGRRELSWSAGVVYYGDPTLKLYHCQ